MEITLNREVPETALDRFLSSINPLAFINEIVRLRRRLNCLANQDQTLPNHETLLSTPPIEEFPQGMLN